MRNSRQSEDVFVACAEFCAPIKHAKKKNDEQCYVPRKEKSNGPDSFDLSFRGIFRIFFWDTLSGYIELLKKDSQGMDPIVSGATP